ncbi:MAG: phosphohydrolase [Spirochaetota bacterium]
MSDLLAKAVAIAQRVHADQVDKVGAPYILHVMRVMNRGQTLDEKICGVLHDVVEDSPVTFDDLRAEGFPEHIIAALRCVTKTSETENYEAFIERIKTNPLAVRVKLNDLEDNMDVRRMVSVGPKEAERLNKYLKAYRALTGTL